MVPAFSNPHGSAYEILGVSERVARSGKGAANQARPIPLQLPAPWPGNLEES